MLHITLPIYYIQMSVGGAGGADIGAHAEVGRSRSPNRQITSWCMKN